MDDDDGRNIDFELMLFFLFQENCINRYRLLDGLGASLVGAQGWVAGKSATARLIMCISQLQNMHRSF